ncbi:MAG TPA: hypothetical protein EYP24_05020 [bacterium (Candidatus Stahlbacteria)]|nr:hypothetical protein [Candidatus Stahlbacteria bacterium]
MILIILGIVDSFPTPDPFTFNVESIPLPEVKEERSIGLDLLFINPVGAEISFWSIGTGVRIHYRKGEDWTGYDDRYARGRIAFPIGRLVFSADGSYRSQFRIDSLTSYTSKIGLTGVDQFIFQSYLEFSHHRIQLKAINEYSVMSGFIFHRLGFTPRITIEKIQSPFSKLLRFGVGVSPQPISLSVGYDENPSVRLAISHSGRLIKFGGEARRGTEPLQFSSLYYLDPIRYSDSMNSAFLNQGYSLWLGSRLLRIKFFYQNYESFPVIGDGLKGRMGKVWRVGGSLILSFPLPIDTIGFQILKTDEEYRPDTKLILYVKILNTMKLILGYEDYGKVKSINPGLSIRWDDIHLRADYLPDDLVIYPGYPFKKRLSLSIGGEFRI